MMTPSDYAALIDHTALKAETTPAQIQQLCREARELGCASVCVNPVYVSMAARFLEGTAVKVCTVVGFPLGAATTACKVFEAREAIKFGATEIDMVQWVGGVKAGQFDWVEEDISRLADTCRDGGAILKVIFENALLTDDEKTRCSKICVSAGAHFVKTSTGFSSSGATVEDVRLMSAIAKPAGLGVKAAGGIRTLSDMKAMLAAGATRVGASATLQIIEQARAEIAS
jgi:deoxyribose-phosphate aldolase